MDNTINQIKSSDLPQARSRTVRGFVYIKEIDLSDIEVKTKKNAEVGGFAVITPEQNLSLNEDDERIFGELKPFKVPKEYIEKFNPQPGGVFLIHENGFMSYQTDEFFRKGMQKLNP